ncbi:VLRF1 family aeRF1-type release factor [Exiguobacterium oxidotolerans]|uniref:Uncharacterized protein n=1 Tax=Exiguobacterium oxidotolerans TaxID=223958 RepID=A0A653IHR7_9BACL|nr:VLRF1 family aeRF1-type release factor [Exiguobacterium oxidotolerans]VWX38700.1 conserved hypothetical protein [Exiguobacterium oxidotolerans]
MGLGEDIERLKKVDGTSKVLSIYLNTAPEKRNQWETVLRNEKKKLLQGDEKADIERLFTHVEKAIANKRTDLLRSIVAFVSVDGSLDELRFLQLDVTNEVSYQPKPNLNQLEVLDQQFPRTGIVLTNLDSATVLDVRLGEVEATHDYELDLDTGEWRRYQGGSGRSSASSNTQSDEYQNRVAEQADRFYRNLAQEVEKMNRSLGWEQIILLGERSQANFLENALTTKPKQVIHKNLSQSSQQQILKQVF